MKFWVKTICILVMCGVNMTFAQGQSRMKKTSSKPNLLLIISDQWRGQALGFWENEPVRTPVLDSLAKKSFVLKQMVSNFPLCSPARAMLLTGNYPLKNHVYSNINSSSAPDSIELRKEDVCWSDVLKSNGYFNGYIGKWHLDSPHLPYIDTYNNKGEVAWNEWTPPDRRHGFDYWYSYGTYDRHQHPMYWDTNDSRDSFHYVDEWGPIHETDKALAFLTNKKQALRPKGKPFALVVSYNPPHSEYQQVPDKYYQYYKNTPIDSLVKDPDIPPADSTMGKEYRNTVKYYYADITGIDEQIGRLLYGLRKNHLDKNTLVVVMADHGNCLGKHNEISKNNFYEASLNIPFIVYWQGHILPRTDSVFLGSLPDIYPTLLELLGLKNKIPASIDGKSYASYIFNKSNTRPSEQFILGGIPSKNVRINAGFRGIRTNQYKLVYTKKAGKTTTHLYDLQKDPFELTDIYPSEDKTIIARLKYRLQEWLSKTHDPFQLN